MGYQHQTNFQSDAGDTMGLDTVVVAFFVVGTILVVAGTLTMGTHTLIESSYNGYISASQTTMERLHTNIEIQNIVLNGETNHLHLTVNNTGETKLDNFELWDVILVKNDQASYLNINADYKIIFNEGLLNPGILDPHETIDIELLSEFNSGDRLLVEIITENGIVSSINYVMGG